MQAFYDGAPVALGGGASSSPVGSIIAYIGTKAPNGYLVCDGGEYLISDYPDLANLFKADFGKYEQFGGDGITTFGVPDLRNLFLRGYHGDAADKLSGELGELQEPTKINTFSAIAPGLINMAVNDSGASFGENADKYFGGTYERLRVSSPYAVLSTISSATSMHYSTRPANMAVLFCIRAGAL